MLIMGVVAVLLIIVAVNQFSVPQGVGGHLSPAANIFVDYGNEIGLDEEQFREDMLSVRALTALRDDMEQAVALGANYTPYLLLNGERIENPASYEAFAEIIEEAIPQNAGPGAGQDGWSKGGGDDASVVITKYSDFQCPACQAYAPVLDILIEEFGDDLRVVYKHLPLPQHDHAQTAALAAEAAGMQGAFWQMHDLLFERQDHWAQGQAPTDTQTAGDIEEIEFDIDINGDDGEAVELEIGDDE